MLSFYDYGFFHNNHEAEAKESTRMLSFCLVIYNSTLPVQNLFGLLPQKKTSNVPSVLLLIYVYLLLLDI